MNLVTHSLGVNFYLLAPPQSVSSLSLWAENIDQTYSEQGLEKLIRKLSDDLGAQTMSFSAVSYDPHGASANLLIAQHVSTLAHLDASHISSHTYFDVGNIERWSTFRLELEISTCGDIHPMSRLNELFHKLKPHFATVDSRSRGAETDSEGLITLAGNGEISFELEIDGYDLHLAKRGFGLLVSRAIEPVIEGAITGILKNYT